MRSNGCRTVVRRGVLNPAAGISSNPITLMSSGTRSPESRKAQIAPIAEMSLYANKAVNFSFRSSNCFVNG